MSDYDGAWKALMDRFLRLFLAFFFPRVEEEIDWSEPVIMRDPNLQKIIPAGEVGDRIADKLFVAKVKVVIDGRQTHEVRLYHAEVQGNAHQNFEQRVYRYNYRADDAEAQPADSLVILADEDEKWRPTSYKVKLQYSSLIFEFEPSKLLDFGKRKKWLRKHKNPVGLFTLAHLETRKTAQDDQERAKVKLDLLLELASRKLDEDDARIWYSIFDRLLYLEEIRDAAVYAELARVSREKGMEFVTRAEKVGLQKGKIEGLLSGLRAMLRVRFKGEGEALMPTIEKITDAQKLANLLTAAETAPLDDIRNLLVASAAPAAS